MNGLQVAGCFVLYADSEPFASGLCERLRDIRGFQRGTFAFSMDCLNLIMFQADIFER